VEVCGIFVKCYVGFSYHDNIISSLIAAKMGKGYSHVFMLFEWNERLIVLNATGKGIVAYNWDGFKSVNKIVKLVQINDASKIEKAFNYCITRLGQPYGFLAIVAIGLGIHYEDGEKTLICSEYVARALDLKFDKMDDLVTPADIEDKL
jgi:uncharacterized protein YycO